MQDSHDAVIADPFAMLIDPQAVLHAIEQSGRLGALASRVCRPLDKPLIPKRDVEETAHVRRGHRPFRRDRQRHRTRHDLLRNREAQSPRDQCAAPCKRMGKGATTSRSMCWLMRDKCIRR